MDDEVFGLSCGEAVWFRCGNDGMYSGGGVVADNCCIAAFI